MSRASELNNDFSLMFADNLNHNCHNCHSFKFDKHGRNCYFEGK